MSHQPQESWAKNLFIWSDFTLGFSKVKHVLMAVVSFLVDTICIGSPMR